MCARKFEFCDFQNSYFLPQEDNMICERARVNFYECVDAYVESLTHACRYYAYKKKHNMCEIDTHACMNIGMM